MNCNFKILWYDDEPDWIDSIEEEISAYIMDQYALKLEVVKDNGSTLPESSLKNNEYDLILMDYHLIGSTLGNELTDRIRSHSVYTDVLLYSGDFDNLIKTIKDEIIQSNKLPLAGVHYTSRVDEKIKPILYSLIDKNIRKFETAQALRGFVLDNSTKFEKRTKTILTTCFDKFKDNDLVILQKAALNKLKSKYSDYSKEMSNQIGELENDLNLACDIVLEKHDKYFSHTARLKLIETVVVKILLQNMKFDSKTESEFNNFKENYMKEIGNYRNALSHVTDSEQTIEIDNIMTNIDDDLFKKLRKNIHNFDIKFKKIEDALNAVENQ